MRSSPGDAVEVLPVVVVSQPFPARPYSIPDIRDSVWRCLAGAPPAGPFDSTPLEEEP